MSDRISRSIIYYAFAALLFFTLGVDGAHAAKGSVGKSDFAFAVKCNEATSDRLCLLGKFKDKIKVTVLQSGPKNTCSATTTSRVEEDESSGANLTELIGSCEFPKEFSIALFRKAAKDYEGLFLKEVVNADVISKTDRLVRNSRALLTLLKKAQGAILGETKELEETNLKVYQVSMPGQKFLIASFEYSNENLGVSGPRLLVINDRVYPLTGWCSYQTLNVFRLEGQYYIQSGSCCCNCGITIMELFRITPEGPMVVLSDESLSD